MDKLHCPSCGHLVGLVEPARAARPSAPRKAPAVDESNGWHKFVVQWWIAEGWDGWEPSPVLRDRFLAWHLSRGVQLQYSQVRFSKVLAQLGAPVRRSNGTRFLMPTVE